MARFDVDFHHVRQNADIVAVLAHYNVSLNGNGEQRKGRCPLHEDSRNSLSVNTDKNLFQCHACGSAGNVIKFVQLVDDELENPRRAALQIAKLSKIPARPGGAVDASASEVKVPAVEPRAAEGDVAGSKEAEMEVGEELVRSNRPLTFQLQLAPVAAGGDSPANDFVEAHGLDYERLVELGIGIGQRGSMKDRLAIPIHNVGGELVAYCGRDVGLLGDAVGDTYKFPDKFIRELELYGWHEAQNFETIVVVEHIMAVVKHSGAAAEAGEYGFGVVALMGQDISDEQIELLLQTSPRVVVCLSGDTQRELQGMAVATYLASSGLWVTTRSCPGFKKPEDVDNEAFCGACGVE